MTDRACDNPDCTYPQTGICVRGISDPQQCPSRQTAIARLRGEAHVQVSEPSEDNEGAPDSEGVSGDAVLAPPHEKPSLPRSGTLGLRDADSLMGRRYVHLVGVVGLPDAGKTACLASLYLLLAHGSLVGFEYVNSQTLVAFDEIARGTRRWNDGNPPEQMTAHTELADDRQAGFLHLRLRRLADGLKYDLLLPDLPGEWSQALLSKGEHQKFAFLKSAEVIWLMASGRDFVDERTRQLAIYHATNLIERLSSVLPHPLPRVIFVASWRDIGTLPDAVIESIRRSAESFGFTVEFAPIASFSDNDDIHPGDGLAELITATLPISGMCTEIWPANNSAHSRRSFLNFGMQR
jgi:hypothetical protein